MITIICKKCNQEVQQGSKFCPNCGTSVDGTALAQSAPESTPKKKGCLRYFLYAIVAVSIFGMLGSCMGGKSNDSNGATMGKATTTEQKKAAEPENPKVSMEFRNALFKGQMYSDTMHMSKAAIYNQLTSQYGEKFPKDAADYAIANIKADYKKNALEKAKTYQKEIQMSASSIHNQLMSSYGEKFTQEEADYAIANLPK